jgi:fibronectin type 3 domain-containing protein
MEGFKRHIAAGIAITVVFVVCAVTLFIAAVPVAPTVEGTQSVNKAGAFSYASMVPDVVPAEAAPAEPPQEEAHNTAAPPAPLPPASDTVDPSLEVPADGSGTDTAAPVAEEPERVINPPSDLTGEFIAKDPPKVKLTWSYNNPEKNVKYFLVYRVVEGEPIPGDLEPIKKTRKTSFTDKNIESGLTYRYWVTAVATWGEESGPSEPVVVETFSNEPPAAPQGVDPVAIEPGVSIDWIPNSDPNLMGYRVYRQKRDGTWRKLTKDSISDNHYYDKKGKAGKVYAVTAVNVYKIESEKTIVEARQSVPVTYEEEDPSISVEGLWVIEQYEGPTNGKIRVAEDAGSRLHFQFKGRQVQIIAAKYWTCGSANVYIDGELVATVDMYSSSPTYKVVDFDMPGLKYGDHILTVEVVGSGNPVEPYNFVNVDAFIVR